MMPQDLIEDRRDTLRRLYSQETNADTRARLDAGIRTLNWVLQGEDE